MADKEKNISEEVEEETPTADADAKEEASEETATEAEASEESSEKSSIFGKKKKKDKKDEKIEELEDKLKRNLAEFENFRKRSEKEKSQRYDMGVRAAVEKLLPIIDNFERGMAMKPEDENTAFTDGMAKVYRQFTEMLDGLGVKPIEAVGQKFDPNFHNAVMQDTESDAETDIVVDEFQKGYMLNDTVIRYSMVKVKA